MTLRAIDLFAGAGGLSRGLNDAGFEIVAAAENWRPAIRSYSENFPRHLVIDDDLGHSTSELLKTLKSVSPIDLLVGGPPCQGFSIQRIGNDHDDRNTLIYAFADIVAELRPRMFLMENVPGLLGHRGRNIAQQFMRRVANSGYDLETSVVDAASFGVPQIRRRVIFVGWLRELLPRFDFPEPILQEGEYRTVDQAIGDLPPPPDDYSASPSDPLHRKMKLSPLNVERLRLIPPGGGFESLPVRLRVNCHKAGADRIGHRAVYGRLDGNRPANTITARFDSFTRGRFAHPRQDRNITLREGARLQSFPDDHIFYGTQEEIAAQIGNAVPPLLAVRLATSLRDNLTKKVSQAGNSRQGTLLQRFASFT